MGGAVAEDVLHMLLYGAGIFDVVLDSFCSKNLNSLLLPQNKLANDLDKKYRFGDIIP